MELDTFVIHWNGLLDWPLWSNFWPQNQRPKVWVTTWLHIQTPNSPGWRGRRRFERHSTLSPSFHSSVYLVLFPALSLTPSPEGEGLVTELNFWAPGLWRQASNTSNYNHALLVHDAQLLAKHMLYVLYNKNHVIGAVGEASGCHSGHQTVM